MASERDERGRWARGNRNGGRPAGVVELHPRRRSQRVLVKNLSRTDLTKLDRRTSLGQLVAARLNAHERQLNRAATVREGSLIQRLVHLELQAELIEQSLRRGEAMPALYLLVVDRIERLARRLGLRPSDAAPLPLPSLEDWLKEKAQEAREDDGLTVDPTEQEIGAPAPPHEADDGDGAS